MATIKVGIAGAAGYTGCELIRLLEHHPGTDLCWLMTGETNAGKSTKEVFPHLRGVQERKFSLLNPGDAGATDLVFMCMPHGLTAALVPEFLKTGCRIIDLSADYRLKDASLYEQWYETKHGAPHLLEEAVYGLTELYRAQLPGAGLVANPGCYPTVSILALAPLLNKGLVSLDSLVIDAKSGVSGAGRGLSLGTHYSECNEDFLAYKPMVHRHMPEIEQELSLLAGEKLSVCFVPHLVPMTRGMLVTVYCRTTRELEAADVQALYRDFYRGESFVRILEQEDLPRTKDVWGTNNCEIALRCYPENGTIIVVAVIDNLIKGASGQAVQNMNAVFELPETTGLDRIGLYP